jgi:ribosomal protein S12 methylthiotransferase
VRVLVEEVSGGDVEGRAAHQGPEVDGSVRLTGDLASIKVGDLVDAVVLDSEGVDLVAELAAEPAGRS